MTKFDCSELINYDLQRDYVDKLSDKEKLALFRNLDDTIKDIADKKWQKDENYSEEFMITWITNHYSEEVTTPFINYFSDDASDVLDEYEPWDIEHVITFSFSKEFTDFENFDSEPYEINEGENSASFLCPSFFYDVPSEFLISWALEWYEIEEQFVEGVTLDG